MKAERTEAWIVLVREREVEGMEKDPHLNVLSGRCHQGGELAKCTSFVG